MRVMTVNHEALKAATLLLENDIDAVGWDQPSALYAVMGDPQDPRLDLLAKGSAHPIRMLQALYEQHGSPSEDVLGLAVATEAWTHATLDVARDHDPLRGLAAQAREDGWPEEEIEQTLDRVWTNIALHVLPSQMPEPLRDELRAVVAVARDGDSVLIGRRRRTNVVSHGGVMMGSAIAEALCNVLAGRAPEQP